MVVLCLLFLEWLVKVNLCSFSGLRSDQSIRSKQIVCLRFAQGSICMCGSTTFLLPGFELFISMILNQGSCYQLSMPFEHFHALPILLSKQSESSLSTTSVESLTCFACPSFLRFISTCISWSHVINEITMLLFNLFDCIF